VTVYCGLVPLCATHDETRLHLACAPDQPAKNYFMSSGERSMGWRTPWVWDRISCVQSCNRFAIQSAPVPLVLYVVRVLLLQMLCLDLIRPDPRVLSAISFSPESLQQQRVALH
ncbi:unnamed protein product, partial [Scytosiphon promiscuus]